MFAGSFSPSSQSIVSSRDFISYFLDTENLPLRIAHDQPVPERRTEIQSVVKIVRRYKDIGIQ